MVSATKKLALSTIRNCFLAAPPRVPRRRRPWLSPQATSRSLVSRQARSTRLLVRGLVRPKRRLFALVLLHAPAHLDEDRRLRYRRYTERPFWLLQDGVKSRRGRVHTRAPLFETRHCASSAHFYVCSKSVLRRYTKRPSDTRFQAHFKWSDMLFGGFKHVQFRGDKHNFVVLRAAAMRKLLAGRKGAAKTLQVGWNEGGCTQT